MTAPQDDKFYIIQRVKALTAQLQEILNNTTRTAAQAIHIGNLIDSGSLKHIDTTNPPRFDKCIEDFYAVCDQIENNLKTAIESHQQGACSGRYLGLPVIPTRLEPGPIEPNHISYPQYLNSTRSQISYLKEVHDLLLNASQNVGPLD
ncbi:hypothetical protein V9T40_002749 [Parthenolecanium corni]|uniref:Mediator of RNA polymerase II transcription subunit 29 n=1 Tax=Parthenolecanium corni TaxID=536013 RepID=A0AAN9Y413_9HEMI